MKNLDYLNLDPKQTAPIVEGLSKLLADFQIYYTNLRGFHWNIKGRGFFTLHEKFEHLYDEVAEKVDEIAERILQLDGTPENKFSEYIKQSSIREVGVVSCGNDAIVNILETLKLLIAREREILAAAAEAGDDVTAALMGDYLRSQEKQIWMFVAFQTSNCK
ncbi:DNA starvation/stationary phase protection protein [Alloprevotella sp. OH1205_COT-284]|uniref:Dps family protein n=1 Tax=Alloprevotella sp. OH1205_COT-284 TaxID=2491043 RepID=UPI000F5FA88C|nr:Dps family protein [Alloprevotella sp. OH1205_COT-284]RRD79667.1 DNA starvation/stationary phase protection protein [Alloprevotella sp. OH1205_COT-284]